MIKILAIIKKKISSLANKSLVKDASWMLISQIINIFIQAIYFIIIARVLGAANYGSFIAVTAICSIIFPFIALGSEQVLMQKVALDRNAFSTYWGNCLLILLTNGTLFSFIGLFFSYRFFTEDISLLTISCILIADLLCLGLIDFCVKAFMSVELVDRAARLIIFTSGVKLLAAIYFAKFIEYPSIENWAFLYVLNSVIVSGIALLTVNLKIGFPKPKFSTLNSVIKQGIYFSISSSASNINANLDQTMLASMSTFQATGIYGAANRFIVVGNVPVISLFGPAYIKFFKYGASGIQNTLKFAKKLLPYALIYSIVSFAGYHILAPWIPKILGEEYQNAISALLLLSPLPGIFAFQLLAADSLTGAGYQKARSVVQVSAAILNITLNFWLIPIYSWKGAAWATLISDTIRMISLWIIVLLLSRKAALENK